MTQAQNQMVENVQYYTYVSAPMGNSREFGDQWNTIQGVQETLKLLNEWISNATTHLIDIEQAYHLDAKAHHDAQDKFRDAGMQEADN